MKSMFQVLAGKPGSIGTWSIERPTAVTAADIDEKLLSAVMKPYVMTEEQLVENGFPRPDPAQPGRVVMKHDPRRRVDPGAARLGARLEAGAEDRRVCDRCGAVYSVDEEGGQLGVETCVHHWGRLFRRRGNRGESLSHVYIEIFINFKLRWTTKLRGPLKLCIYNIPTNMITGRYEFVLWMGNEKLECNLHKKHTYKMHSKCSSCLNTSEGIPGAQLHALGTGAHHTNVIRTMD